MNNMMCFDGVLRGSGRFDKSLRTRILRIRLSSFDPSALRIRLFSSPFIFSDEGLSFGGSCPGFDASGCPGQKVGRHLAVKSSQVHRDFRCLSLASC